MLYSFFTKLVLLFNLIEICLSARPFGLNDKPQYNSLIDYFEGTCSAKNDSTKGRFTNIKIRSDDEGKQFIDYDFVCDENFPKNLMLVWTAQKCSTKESSDSCMRFQKISTKLFCRMMLSKNDVWSPFIDCVKPEWKCPYQKGTYVGRNCTFDLSRWNFFPLQGNYWKSEVELRDVNTNEMLMCFTINASVVKKA